MFSGGNAALDAFELAKRKRDAALNVLNHDNDGYDDGTSFESWREDFRDLDLYKLLKIQHVNGKLSGGESRLLAAFHSRATLLHAEDEDPLESKRFREAVFAFTVLRDVDRRRVYTEHGFQALEKWETYVASSVFDVRPRQIVDDFYNGVDEPAREFLMLKVDDYASGEEWSDAENDDDREAADEEEQTIIAAALKASKANPSASENEPKMPHPPSGESKYLYWLDNDETRTLREASNVWNTLTPETQNRLKVQHRQQELVGEEEPTVVSNKQWSTWNDWIVQ